MKRRIATVVLLLATGSWSSLSGQFAQKGAGVRPTEAEQNLHAKCVEAEEHAERQAADMVPGRTWTWALNAQRSLHQLNELGRGLTALKECEAEFEASLAPSQATKYQPQLHGMAGLSQHLERDVQSLDDELRKGHPRRWHVAHDALDMQKEIQHWRRLHNTVWTGLSKAQEGTAESVRTNL
jgi:hypothetical protein